MIKTITRWCTTFKNDPSVRVFFGVNVDSIGEGGKYFLAVAIVCDCSVAGHFTVWLNIAEGKRYELQADRCA